MDEHLFKYTIALIIVLLIATAIFCWNLFTILGMLPRENQKFPRWFVWLFLIPWIGFVFQWMMLPFGIPDSFRKTFPVNQEAINDANMLFKVGLAEVIFTSFGILFHISPLNQIADSLGLVLWVVYWVLIFKFRNKYLMPSKSSV